METTQNTFFKEITGTIDEIIREVRKLIREGNARSLIIKNKKGRVLFQSQLTVGVAGTALITAMAPFISAITMFVMFANDVQVFVEKEKNPSGEQENPDEDEYEVDGEIIEIQDKEEDDSNNDDDDPPEQDKTVGKG